MQIVTKYRAIDGSEWDTADQAMDRDNLCAAVADAIAELGEPLSSAFFGGGGYRQHDLATVLSAKQRIVRLAKIHTGHGVFDHPAADIHPFSIAGQILDDVGGPLRKAWRRFMCIDDQGREWGQPYFGLHPTEGQQIRLNQ